MIGNKIQSHCALISSYFQRVKLKFVIVVSKYIIYELLENIIKSSRKTNPWEDLPKFYWILGPNNVF